MSATLLPGSLHPSNLNAISWNLKGLLVYGSHCTVVVFDVLQNKIIRTLEKHSSAVTHIVCSPEEELGFSTEIRLRCASVDVGGIIVVWDLLEGVQISTFSSANSTPLQIAWFPWEDTTRDFLVVLHAPNNFVLWNTATGHQIWSVTYAQALNAFAIDPFDARNVTFGVIDGSLLIVDNVLLHKAPLERGSSLNCMSLQKPISQITYHNACTNFLFVAASNEIACVEMECRCVLWRQTIDTPLLRMFSCRERNALFTISTNGVITLFSAHTVADDKDNVNLQYLELFSCETQRQNVHHRLFSVELCPVTQTTFALIYNSGNITFYQLGCANDETVMQYRSRFITDLIKVDDKMNCSAVGCIKHSIIAQTFSLGFSSTTLRMRPLDSVEEEELKHLVAVGNSQGVVRLLSVHDGIIYKQLHIHTCPIKCLDWGGPHTLISAAYLHSISTSSFVKNDIFVTDIRTGESRRLRPEVEETPVEMIRTSFYHCYIAIGFRNEPLEIWHLKSMRLLRRMSRSCPVIIDMAWSGKHHALKKIIEGADPVFRENLVVLDEECRLYHVVIKGLHVRDGKEVNSEASDAWRSSVSVKCLVWKDDLLAMGDTLGRLGVWNLGQRHCQQTKGSSRGPILKMVFSRLNGDYTLAVLHREAVALWDADQIILLQQYTLGMSLSFVDLDLYGNSPIVICSDNSFRCMQSVANGSFGRNRDSPLLVETSVADFLSKWTKCISKPHCFPEIFETYAKMTNQALKNAYVHRFFGDRWLYDLWLLVDSSLRSNAYASLPSHLSLFWKPNALKQKIENTLCCLMSCPDLAPTQLDILVHLAIILQKREWAMQMLLGSRDECRLSALRACLLASDVSSEGAQSIIKLVATNLIASDCMTDGIQMLFLIGHGDDACRYLQAHGLWSKSFIFAKLTMDNWMEVGGKWLDYLTAIRTQKNLSCFLAANIADWDRLLSILVHNGMADVGQRFLKVLEAQSVSVPETTVELVTDKTNQCIN